MARRKKAPQPQDGPLAGARILVVDDHAFTLGLIKDVLYAGGAAQVMSALDGGEAIDLLRSFGPDLVVTDWNMPGMNGLVFAQTIRRAATRPDPRVANPQVPIVLVSAHASATAVEAARLAGVNEVVTKPFSVTSLLQRITAAARNPRAFLVTDAYVGPDRRRYRGASEGRRTEDLAAEPESPLRALQLQLDTLERETLARAAGPAHFS